MKMPKLLQKGGNSQKSGKYDGYESFERLLF